VRARGDHAGNRGRDYVLRRRWSLFPTAAAATAATTVLRIRDERNGRDHDEHREHLQIADPWSHSWPPIQLFPRVRLARASSRRLFASGVCDEKRRHRVDLVGHDLRTTADHEKDEISPLFARLLVDLEHPAERRVTRGADLRHHGPPLFDLWIGSTLRTSRDGQPQQQSDREQRDPAVTH
jgi:hypothetical protein